MPLLRGWLRAMRALARPLARLRVPPTALTVLGVLLAVDALLLASALPWVALALILLSVLCDGLDGAVAVFQARASRFGSVADKAADRLADCAFALVIWRCGAPWWLAVLAGGISLVHEGIRVIVGGALLPRITVAERPTRTICALLACLCSGLGLGPWTATVCASVWITLGLVGLAQLAG